MTIHLGDPGRDAAVSGPDRRTLDGVFAHPVRHDVAWTDVVSLIERIGTVEEGSNNAFVLRVGGKSYDVHKPHTQHLTAPEILGLRHFIDEAGWSPRTPSEAAVHPTPPAPSLIVVIDHHETRVYAFDLNGDDGAGRLAPYDPQHLLRNASRRQGSADHPDRALGDRAYHELIADAVAAGGAIVVVGHGPGEASAAHDLASFLRDHHPDTYRRIVRETVADVAALNSADLLRIARAAFSPNPGGPADVLGKGQVG